MTAPPPTRRPPGVHAILDAARRLVGAAGIDATSLAEIASAAGVPLGVLRYHFRSKDHLLIEAWRATFRRIHEHYESRFEAGEHGLPTAMEALDALWMALQDMQGWAPFMVQTLAAAARDRALGDRMGDFNAEAAARVELGLLRAFHEELDRLTLPPGRLSRAVRAGLYGLIVELALCRTPEERAAVEQTYRDVRGLLERVVLSTPPAPLHPH